MNPALETLKLDYNYITHVHPGALTRFTNPKSLGFSYNQIGIVALRSNGSSELAWIGQMDSKKVDFTGNPSVCYWDEGSASVQCWCMWSQYDDYNSLLPGGERGLCSCPLGTIWKDVYGARVCYPCDADTYNEILSAQSCKACPADHISDPSSMNHTACRLNPLVVIEAKDHELALRSQQFLILGCIAASAIILLLLGGGWFLGVVYQRALDAELELKSGLQVEVWNQKREIEYLRDWRVNPLVSKGRGRAERGPGVCVISDYNHVWTYVL